MTHKSKIMPATLP